MKTYKSLERMFNIINRASEECNYIVDESDELINILGGAIESPLQRCPTITPSFGGQTKWDIPMRLLAS